NPKFLILDEPTAVLTPQEADQLFIVLDRLKAEGRAILYISHKLEEVKRLCDTATILRGGKKVSTCNPKAETAASLARMMVGAAGHLSITQRRKLGAAFVPEERLGHGTAPRMKLSENALLTGHAASGMVRHGFIDTAATLKTVDRATETFDVRKAKRDPEAASLSGGNLQKFMVGREILRNPAVLVVSQPTWGVDAGAAAVIRQALLDLAAGGAAVLVTSQDLDELTEIADRIAVMFHGRLSAPLPTADASREKLGLLMGGSRLDQKDTAHAVGA